MTDDKSKPMDAASRLSQLRSGGAKRPLDAEPEEDFETAEEIQETGGESYSLLSSARMQKIMLEFRKISHDSDAFPYSFLVRAKFNPSKEILLDFSIAKVRIIGRNLRPLFLAIVAQRVSFVQEKDELHAEAESEEGKTFVTGIEVIEPDEDASAEPASKEESSKKT